MTQPGEKVQLKATIQSSMNNEGTLTIRAGNKEDFWKISKRVLRMSSLTC